MATLLTTGEKEFELWELAVEWFFLAHDERSGRSMLSPVHTGIGLGTALLSELLIGRFVRLRDDLVLAATRQPPPDVLAHQVFSLIAGEPEPLSVRMWLAYLSRTVRDDVGAHLQRRGMVHAERSLLRRRTRWIPHDLNVAGRPENRIRTLLSGGEGIPHDALLGEISDLTGLLGGILDAEAARTARSVLPGLVARFSDALRVLLREARTAVSSSVLSERQ